jgi:very-short-patch-repair endonuclease
MAFQKGDSNWSRTHEIWNKRIPCRESTKRKIQEHHLSHPELFQYWLGKRRSKKTKEKMPLFKKGSKPWNKRLSKEELAPHYPNGWNILHAQPLSKEAYRKIGIKQRGKYVSPETCKKITETKLKRYASGQTTPPMLGKHHSDATRNKMSRMQKARPSEITRRCLTRHIPSSIEALAMKKFKQLNLSLKFTGNGKFTVGNKCPDFISIKNRIAVEVFCKKHKEDFREGCKNWKARRRAYFARRGWKLIFLEQKELTFKTITKKLGGGFLNAKA